MKSSPTHARHALCIAALSWMFCATSHADFVGVNLTFDSLPSAQGWTYNSQNSPLSESQAFSVDGTVLRMNTMGQGFPSQGDNYYGHPVSAFPPGADWELFLRARIPQLECVYHNPSINPYGFGVIVQLDGLRVDLALASIVKLGFNDPGMYISLDTSLWHDYRFVANRTQETYKFLIDNNIVASGPLSLGVGLPDGIYLGDLTGGENAVAEVASFSMVQTVPEPSKAWLLSLVFILFYRGRTAFRK